MIAFRGFNHFTSATISTNTKNKIFYKSQKMSAKVHFRKGNSPTY